jgi:hypothetical protein
MFSKFGDNNANETGSHFCRLPLPSHALSTDENKNEKMKKYLRALFVSKEEFINTD